MVKSRGAYVQRGKAGGYRMYFKKYEKVKEEEAKGNNLRGGKIPGNKRVSGGAEGEENGKDEVKL